MELEQIVDSKFKFNKTIRTQLEKVEEIKFNMCLDKSLDTPIFVYFTSFSFEEKLYDLARKNIKNFPIITMDVTSSKKMAKKYGIHEIPTLALVYDRKIIGSFSSKYPEKVKDWLSTNGIKLVLEQYYERKRAENSRKLC
ncbi:MAG: thioredoxin domain-containing protein [Candidatus Nanoarchaeia archaeon]